MEHNKEVVFVDLLLTEAMVVATQIKLGMYTSEELMAFAKRDKGRGFLVERQVRTMWLVFSAGWDAAMASAPAEDPAKSAALVQALKDACADRDAAVVVANRLRDSATQSAKIRSAVRYAEPSVSFNNFAPFKDYVYYKTGNYLVVQTLSTGVLINCDKNDVEISFPNLHYLGRANGITQWIFKSKGYRVPENIHSLKDLGDQRYL